MLPSCSDRDEYEMNGRQIFEVWAPPGSIWSQWVAPVLFVRLEYGLAPVAEAPPPEVSWHESQADPATAIIVDIPGPEAVRLGVSLAARGYRPVPVINASPSFTALSVPCPPQSRTTLDMNSLLNEVVHRTAFLSNLDLPPNAPPAFILDSRRLDGTRNPQPELFDNRWTVFPQDFPSARFLADQGIRRAILVTEAAPRVASDLSHVLLRWHQAGIEILCAPGTDATPKPITVERPSRFRAAWYRALAILGFRRGSIGGFGSYLPTSSAGG